MDLPLPDAPTTATLAPGATHQLMVVCVHGADWAEEPRLRWIADAAAVIGTGEVDWDLLVHEAEARLLTCGKCLEGADAPGLGPCRQRRSGFIRLCRDHSIVHL